MNNQKIREALEKSVENIAEIGQTVIDALDGMNSEQRLIIEFLAENPKVAESLQELSQKLAKQKVIGGATEETAQPQEPLIKDEKVRKAVRAWAEACGVRTAVFYLFGVDSEFWNNDDNNVSISFNFPLKLEDGRAYTIPELCGEEE